MRCDTAVLFVSNRLRMDGNARVWVLAKKAFPRRSFIMCFVWAYWQRRPLFYRAGSVSYHNVRHRLIDMDMRTLQLDVSKLKGPPPRTRQIEDREAKTEAASRCATSCCAASTKTVDGRFFIQHLLGHCRINHQIRDARLASAGDERDSLWRLAGGTSNLRQGEKKLRGPTFSSNTK